MGKYVSLEEARRHLNIEADFTDDDNYINSLIDVSETKIAKELCVKIEDLATVDGSKSIPAPLNQAILLSVGTYYRFREGISTIATKPLEQGVIYLINLYRDYSL